MLVLLQCGSLGWEGRHHLTASAQLVIEPGGRARVKSGLKHESCPFGPALSDVCRCQVEYICHEDLPMLWAAHPLACYSSPAGTLPKGHHHSANNLPLSRSLGKV